METKRKEPESQWISWFLYSFELPLLCMIALLGVAVLITYSSQNGAILLVMAFLISPMGLPLAAIWLLGKV